MALTVPTGAGKSWLASKLGHKACRDNCSMLYHHVPKLFEDLIHKYFRIFIDGAEPKWFITGASGGIGADLARVFARHGHGLVLIARSGTALEALAGEIAVPGRPRPLVRVFDLLELNATTQIATALEAAGVSRHRSGSGRGVWTIADFSRLRDHDGFRRDWCRGLHGVRGDPVVIEGHAWDHPAR